MIARQSFAIVGAGLAAGRAVQELRESGFEGHIVLYGAEPHPPYERPPLSKGYLMGTDDFESALVQPLEWYRDQDIDLRLSTTVTTIDPASRTVTTGDDRQHYDKLLLATGARPRRLAISDDDAPITYLRTIEDAARIKSLLHLGGRLVIVGGGWIGLEVAAAARTGGAHVTVLETRDLPLAHVLGPEVAGIFASMHRAHGVDLRCGTRVSSIESDAGAAIVGLADGTHLEADLVVIGIGVLPQAEVAMAAGLHTDNGIVVDAQLRTSKRDIYAAGDVANAYHPRLGRHLRVEHWDNAIGQGVVAAQNMLGGSVRYDRLPYFFSDQYDLGMEYLGNVGPDGYDQVVIRGTPEDGTFTALWLRGSQVLAGMHANDWDAMDSIRKIVGPGHARGDVGDESLSLAEIAANLD